MSIWFPKRNNRGGWSYYQLPLMPIFLLLNLLAVVGAVIYVLIRDVWFGTP